MAKAARPKFNTDIEWREFLHGPPRIIRSVHDFRPYQHFMANKAIDLPAVYLGAEMGLGKTAASLWAGVCLIDFGVIKKILIVAPLYVAENTWPDEIAGWKFARHLRYTIITGDEKQRLAALAVDADVYIVNRENIAWLHKTCPGRKWIWDMLIYDEASRLKAGSDRTDSGRLSEFGVLARYKSKFKRIVLLSGTPAPNGLVDLWGPMFIIDAGARLGHNITAYREKWFNFDMFKKRYNPHRHSHDEIMGAIDDVFFSLKSDDYISLPPLITVPVWVDLPPKARKLYQQLETTSKIADLGIEAVNGGVLTNKLLQLANGSLYLEDGSSEPVHDAKLDALETIIKGAFGKPVLVAYSFKFDVERIKKRIPKARIFGDNKNDLRDWNNGEIPVMLLHPASAGHGLNFQYGGNIAVWYGLNWSLELYLQFIKRLHRSGQNADKVLLHRILARKTVDADVADALVSKGAVQDDITDAVRIRLEREQEECRVAA